MFDSVEFMGKHGAEARSCLRVSVCVCGFWGLLLLLEWQRVCLVSLEVEYGRKGAVCELFVWRVAAMQGKFVSSSLSVPCVGFKFSCKRKDKS
jgi:hypothetical protein